MKKIILVCVCCLVAMGAMASGPINLGLHAGWTNSKLELKHMDQSLDNANGFVVGVFGRINVSKLYIAPAIDIMHEKGENLKINTLQIPVMLGYNVFDLKVAKIRAFIGPEASVLLSDKVGDLDADFVRNLTWAGRVGVGVDVWKLTFDIDYKFGLGKFSDHLKTPKGVNMTVGFKIF